MSESTTLRRAGRKPAEPSWADLPEKELLKLRLKDLDLSISGTWLDECLDVLNAELKARKIQARVHCWISDEWFSPDNTPGISIPFYLAHPRLMRLEKKMMHSVEGGTRRECLQIMRHEAGHVVQHAYGLHRKKKWQTLFGNSSKRYPTSYRPNPASKDYVQHLRRWYAQAHPDEDFAETFAVWLTPRMNWRKKYAGWPALKKIEYVDELMTEIVGEKPHLSKRLKVDPLSKLTMTLGEHYEKKRAYYSVGAPAVFDTQLTQLFRANARSGNAPSAATFIRGNREHIRNMLNGSHDDYLLTLDAVLDDMIERCRALKLKASGSPPKLRTQLANLVTNREVRSLYDSTRRQRFAV